VKRLLGYVRSEKGYVLVLVALGMVLLLGFLGLVFDVGYEEYTKREMQTAADAAAQAGALEIVRGDSSGLNTAAQGAATTNGFTNDVNNVTVTINNPPETGYYTSNSGAVEAIISQNVPTFFLKILNVNSSTVSARAVAAPGSSPNCVFALDPSMSEAIQTSNGATTNVGCGVMVDSSSSSALYATGSGAINATSISVVGGYETNNNGKLSPTPATGVLPAADPLAALPEPSVGSCTYTNYPNPGSMGGQTVTLSPGTYCNGLNVANGMTAHLNAGTYIISGGGVNFAGGSPVSGSGVTFYVTSGNGYSFAPVVINNGATVTLSAPTSGTYAGVLFFQDRSVANSSSNEAQLAGGANMSLTGALYFPSTAMNISNGTSTSATYTIIVADSLIFTGGITFNANYSSLTNGSPVQTVTLGE
jgi:Flp pilus assembly protein TadG